VRTSEGERTKITRVGENPRRRLNPLSSDISGLHSVRKKIHITVFDRHVFFWFCRQQLMLFIVDNSFRTITSGLIPSEDNLECRRDDILTRELSSCQYHLLSPHHLHEEERSRQASYYQLETSTLTDRHSQGYTICESRAREDQGKRV